MATPYITLGSPTTGGGKVISGQSSFLIEGKPIACVGDKATCLKHKCVSTIVSGDNHMIVMGKPAAQHNSPLSCGCKCIGDQYLTVGDNGGGLGKSLLQSNEIQQMSNFASISNNNSQNEHGLKFQLVDKDSQLPIPEAFYLLITKEGKEISGFTDDSGYTDTVNTGDSPEDVDLHVFDFSKPMDKWE